MRKWLAILGLLLTVAPVVAGQPNEAPDAKQQAAKQVTGQSKPVSADKIDKQTGSQANQAKPNCNAPTWYTAIKWPHWLAIPDWWLVIVAALTGGVICFQSAQTKKSAEAALAQANHIANTERAWLIPHITQPSDRDVMSLNSREDDWTLPIEVTLTNFGKTPAIAIHALIEKSSERKIRDSDDVAPTLILDLKEPPSYEHPNKLGDVYAPGAIYPPQEKTSLYLDIDKGFLLSQKAAWELGEKYLCIKGFIEYKDAFGTYFTRFCYAYQDVRRIRARKIRSRITGEACRDREFRKAGPDSYNEIQ